MDLELDLIGPLVKHKRLSQISLDIWSSILHYLPFKSVLLLLETGDSRIQHVRRVLQHLELNRFQVRFKQFPTSFLHSWSGIRSLSVSITGSIYDTLPDSLLLPPSIRSLTLTVNDLNFIKFISLLRDSYASNTHGQLLLAEIAINSLDFMASLLKLSMEDSEELSDFIKLLPLTSLTCEFSPHVFIMSHLPPTLIHHRMLLYSPDSALTYATPIFPPHLLTLQMYALSIDWASSYINIIDDYEL